MMYFFLNGYKYGYNADYKIKCVFQRAGYLVMPV